MTFEEGRGQLNTLRLDEEQENAYLTTFKPCSGVTLAQLRQRLRNELSGYVAGTLISDTVTNDVERQFINDGIDALWPHDWQTVMYSMQVQNDAVHPNYQARLYLPDDCEHVLAVYSAKIDINNTNPNLIALPHHDFWQFDKSFIDAQTVTLIDGHAWEDAPKRTLQLWHQPCQTWVVARYARKWPHLLDDNECIDPTPNRVHAITYFACAQYFASQFQVNTESIRYRNYQAMAQSFMQMYQSMLIRDSKPLYIV